MNILERIRGDVEGVKLLNDWIGEGGVPVGLVKSQSRANICETCPKNVQPDWYDKNIKLPIAQWVKAQIELKNDLELKASNESKLGVCLICGCSNALKIWTPLKHIKEHTPEGMTFPDYCWISQESRI